MKYRKSLYRKLLLSTAATCLTASAAVQAGSIAHVSTSVRQMAMGGAFIAQVDEASSISINPAGVAPARGTAQISKEFLFYGMKRENSFSETDDSADEILGFFWTKKSGNSGFGIGLYDSSVGQVSYLDNSSTRNINTATLSGFDLAFSYAYSPIDELKVGTTLKATFFGEPESADGKEHEESEYSFKLGAQYQVFDGYLDIANTSTNLALSIGAIYQPEIQLSPFSSSPRHLLSDQDITATPETIGVGSHVRFGWISEALTFRLHLNADYETSLYSDMAELIVNPSTKGNVELVRAMFGSELLITGLGASNTYALRAGVADQTGNIHQVLDETVRSFGLGVVGESISMNLAYEVVEPAVEGSLNRKNMAVEFSVVF